MPMRLQRETYLSVLAASGQSLAERAARLPRDTQIPSCPTWTMAELVAHQTRIHRWATAHLTGEDPDRVPDEQTIAREPDLPAYYRDGFERLVLALHDVPDDVEALVFLRDAPGPRDFWARRQAHETLMHGIDALAGELGRMPTTAEVGVAPALAADGIDELVMGFVPRGRSRLGYDLPLTVAVRPHDVSASWTMRVGERIESVAEAPEDLVADVELSGTAAGLYLGLWNRGDDLEGDPDFLRRWRAGQQVR